MSKKSVYKHSLVTSGYCSRPFAAALSIHAEPPRRFCQSSYIEIRRQSVLWVYSLSSDFDYSENPPPDRRHVFRDAKYARRIFAGRWYACPAGVCRFTLKIRRRIGAGPGLFGQKGVAAYAGSPLLLSAASLFFAAVFSCFTFASAWIRWQSGHSHPPP